jgi:hypothetical protein
LDIQITKTSEFENEISISNDKTEQIIRFIKEKKRVTRSDIRRFCEHKIASKITVDKIVQELLDDNQILEDIKYSNSRNKYLVINNENVLQNVKFELTEIKTLFSKLLLKLRDIYNKSPEQWPHPSFKKMDYLHAEVNIYYVMHIPFAILEIINKIFTYRQITKWNDFDDDLLKKLYFTIFSSMNELMFSALDARIKLMKDRFEYRQNNNNVDYSNIFIYNGYESYRIEERIPLLRHRCKAIGVLSQYDDLVNYLFSKYGDFFIRVCSLLSPSFKFSSIMEHEDKDPKNILHRYFCPGIKSKTCDLLDKDPLFSDFGSREY